MTNQSTPTADLAGRLRHVYNQLTPGCIEHADLDGMALTVKEAIAALPSPIPAGDISLVERLREAVQSAEELRDWLAGQIATCRLEQENGNPDAWKGFGDCMHDGRLASYRDEFAAALALVPPVTDEQRIEGIREALWNSLCPGIRRTAADDIIYRQTAKQVLEALSLISLGEGGNHD